MRSHDEFTSNEDPALCLNEGENGTFFNKLRRKNITTRLDNIRRYKREKQMTVEIKGRELRLVRFTTFNGNTCMLQLYFGQMFFTYLVTNRHGNAAGWGSASHMTVKCWDPLGQVCHLGSFFSLSLLLSFTDL